MLIIIWNLISSIFFYRKKKFLYCGLIGFSGNSEKKLNVDKMKLLILNNQERGKDSLGFYTPENGIYKEIGKPDEQMGGAKFALPESSTFIGHVRAATVGDVTKVNAHPFQYGNIVLAMNGTLTNHYALASEYELFAMDYQVDTQIIAAIIAKTQSKDVLSKMQGPCALLYTDTTSGKMYAFTNGGRTLFRGVIDGCMYISSIENSLKVIGCLNVKPFKDDYLYELDNGKVVWQLLIPKPKQVNYNTALQYDNHNKYSYLPLQIYSMPYSEIKKYWLYPDNTMTAFSIRKGFGYKVVDANALCAKEEVTIINDEGNEVNIAKSKFMYRRPIPSVGGNVISIAKLTYKKPNSSELTDDVYCNEGDLLIVKEVVSNDEYYCFNVMNLKKATVKLKHIKYAFQEEVDWYTSIHFLSELPADKDQLSLPLDGNDDRNENQEESPFKTKTKLEEYVDKFTENLNTDEPCGSFEEHSDFVIDNIEDLLADLSEISNIPEEAIRKIECMKVVLEYYNQHLGNYFEMDDKEENLKHD